MKDIYDELNKLISGSGPAADETMRLYEQEIKV